MVERFTREPTDPDLADPLSRTTVIEIGQPAQNHNGGWIAFGPDGYLYLPLGDGGPGYDPNDNGQNLDTLLGSLLRLDVDGDDFPTDPLRNYSIPQGNPFVGQAGRDEIWAYGLRNSFRSSFDRLTGDLYIGDVGQGSREEIDYQPNGSTGGENYGWRPREGSVASPNCAGGPRPPGNVDPIYDYVHGTGDNQGNCRNIELGPDLLVGDGGDLTLRAGNRVKLSNGAAIETGGALTIELDAALQSTPP